MTKKMDWDLTSYFAGFNADDMQAFKKSLEADMDALLEASTALGDLNQANEEAWEEIILKIEDVLTRLRHLSSYLSCLTSADANDEAFGREEAAASVLGAELSKVFIELQRALKFVTDEQLESFAKREALADVGYFLQRTRRQAQYTMSPAEEALAADLGVNGIEAWGRLYDTVSGKLEFDMEFPDGRKERLSMSRRRALMEDHDKRIRAAAFESGNEAWGSVETVPEAALNAIGGIRLTLNKRRGVDHFLDIALFQAGIKRETLDAMFEAIYSQIEIPRSILKTKAGAMGEAGLSWFDLSAPLPVRDQGDLSWEDGKALVKNTVSDSYPAFGDFIQTTFDKSWIDWSQRPGKRPGAFCTGSPLTKESRIYMTYNDIMGDVLTLAHELGHAYHSHILRQTRTLARSYPMTLAESASTFGEMLLMKGILGDPAVSDELKAYILNLEISHAAVYLLDIPVRYEFEKAFYEERSEGEVSASRLKSLMTENQRRILGDVLLPGGEDPYFWASKLHFYITGITFYNFPYTFGFLLSRGLFTRFTEHGKAFIPEFELFLQRSGSRPVEEVVEQCLGVDLTQPDFWGEAIRSLNAPHNQLKELLPQIK